MLYKLIRMSFILAAFCCLAPKTVSAQTTDAQSPLIIGGTQGIDGANCETTRVDFDSIAGAPRSGVIIIISRLGKGESLPALSARRLQNIREYLMTTRNVPSRQIVIAQGESTKGLGRVEVYISGKLFITFLMKRNRDFFKNCAA